MKLLTAPWVVPVSHPPLENGAVLIDGGLIKAVGPRSSFKNLPIGTGHIHAENSVLLPSFINAHAHLELTALGPIEPGLDFTGWIKKIISLKQNAHEGAFAKSVRLGAEKCLAFGQTVVADVASRPESAAAYPAGPGKFIKLAEIIAASDERAITAVEEASLIMDSPSGEPGGFFLHSPYTAGRAAYKVGAARSIARCGRFFTHLAESPDEIEFCMTGKGAIPDRVYAGLPVRPPEAPGTHPLKWLDGLGLLGPFSVLVHAVQMDGGMMDLAAKKGAPIIVCPRSNKNLKVGAAPLAGFLERGITVGLGTDSILSAGGLDLMDEVRECADSLGIPLLKAVELATLGGARALGLGHERGALSPGLAADILALRLGGGTGLDDRLMDSPGPFGLWVDGLPI